MARHFRDANLKINRAQVHVANLRHEIGALKKRYTSVIKDDAKAGIQELQHTIPDYEDVTANFSLIAGDALHNLRTALDYAWYSALKIHAPKISKGFSKFPIGKSREALKRTLERIKVSIHCPELSRIMLDEFKAYKGDDSFLWALHDLDISDKHIFLIGLIPNASVREIAVEDENGHEVIGSSMLIQSEPPYCFRFKSTWKVKDNGKLSFEVAFKEAGLFKSVQVLEMLRIFEVVVSNTVHRLEIF